MREKLRLRAIDCPELPTPAGQAAKRAVEALVAEALDVTIVTSKVDKYDRYLADVHLTLRSGEEVFLNNHLLQHGHAVRTDGATAETWVP
jgi:endonuclease YncB( thermonuclease family)